MRTSGATDRLRPEPKTRPRALVVDDDHEVLSLLLPAARAVAPDLRIDWAAGLGDAAHQLGRARYDLVLVDWRLSNGESGLEIRPLLEQLQPAAQFAVMTAAPVSEFILLSGAAPCAFLSKPFSIGGTRGFFASVLP